MQLEVGKTYRATGSGVFLGVIEVADDNGTVSARYISKEEIK